MSLRSQGAPRYESVRTSMGIGFWGSIAGKRVSFPGTTAGYWRRLVFEDREMTKALEEIVLNDLGRVFEYWPRVDIYITKCRLD